jgi:hypothetical protein
MRSRSFVCFHPQVFDMLLAGGNALRLEYKGPGTLKARGGLGLGRLL